MKSDRRDFLAATLGPGHAIVRDPRYPEPFCIEIPHVLFNESVTDDEVLERLAQFVPSLYHPTEALLILDAIRRERGIPADAVALLPAPLDTVNGTAREHEPGTPAAKIDKTKRGTRTPKTRADQVLRAVLVLMTSDDPFLTESEMHAAVNNNSGSIKDVVKKKGLFDGYFREHRFQRGKGFVSAWEPLGKAYRELGIKPPKLHSKGGWFHQFAAHRAEKYFLARGYDVVIEHTLPDSGKAVDLAAKNTSELVYLEIAVSPPMTKEISNLEKDLSGSLLPDRLIVATVDSKSRRDLEQLIEQELYLSRFRSRISVRLIGDFIE